MVSLDTICTTLRTNHPHADTDAIVRAYAFAEQAHAGQIRKNGDPYVTHTASTALLLAEWGMPPVMVAAGLLHDVPEDTRHTITDIRHAFGDEIAEIVEGETKLSKLYYLGNERYVENLRKMFVVIGRNMRVIGVKFADRIDNLRTIAPLPPEKQLRVARESLEIYAPIANRLGMMEVKALLEDLSFPIVAPADHAWVSTLIATTYETRRTHAAMLRNTLTDALTVQHIPTVAMTARMKHQYSLYLKLLKHHRDIEQIHDIVALRVIVPNITDCYAVLGVLHEQWKPLKGRIKDYIASPKSNGYQSIHTTVQTEDAGIVEFQIRTPEMHEDAEWGAAAAWRYHERGAVRPPEHQLRWVQDLVAWQRAVHDPQDYVAGLKTEALRDRILVFTPRGDVIELPECATPLDFAYAIHTDIGNRAVGARVNGHTQLHPLDAPLKSGDMVEIITDPKRKGPSSDWLHVVKTTQARSKIKDALRGQERATAAEWGH